MNWGDLAPRVASAIVMAAVAVLALWLGGVYFGTLLGFVAAMMVWELAHMTGQTNPRITAVLPVVVALALVLLGQSVGVGAAVVVGVILALSFGLGTGSNRLFAVAAVVVFIACQFIAQIYAASPVLLIWLVLVVIASDVAGYFVGRAVGGPKFIPAISPKKTWSGTLGGWAAAAGVGVGFAIFTQMTWGTIYISVIVAFAAQMGDIAESALKRRIDVKDSSDLIPGHGGFCDRFDGLVGGAVVLWALTFAGLSNAVL